MAAWLLRRGRAGSLLPFGRPLTGRGLVCLIAEPVRVQARFVVVAGAPRGRRLLVTTQLDRLFILSAAQFDHLDWFHLPVPTAHSNLTKNAVIKLNASS